MASGQDAIGITTTLPIEVLFAAGRRPLDLNNLFVSDESPAALVAFAETKGFPQSACAWIKGIYGAVHKHGIREVVGVVEGDCSDTGALLDVLRSEGVKVHGFAFPHSRRREDLEREIARLTEALGGTLAGAEAQKRELDEIRRLGQAIDERAARFAGPSSVSLFQALLSLSDFLGAPEECRRRLEAWPPDAPLAGKAVRLAVAGVPAILSDLWEVVESCGGRVVFHEIPRQFAMLPAIGKELAISYLEYTYPYDIAARLEDLAREIARRRCQGLLHYVQSFCHRQIHDRLLRERLGIPILTIEADRPGPVDERTRTRIEAFLEQLRGTAGASL